MANVNDVIWNRIPKNAFVEINTLHFGVYDVIATYNRGNIIKCEVLPRFRLTPGKYVITIVLCIDSGIEEEECSKETDGM